MSKQEINKAIKENNENQKLKINYIEIAYIKLTIIYDNYMALYILIYSLNLYLNL